MDVSETEALKQQLLANDAQFAALEHEHIKYKKIKREIAALHNPNPQDHFILKTRWNPFCGDTENSNTPQGNDFKSLRSHGWPVARRAAHKLTERLVTHDRSSRASVARLICARRVTLFILHFK